MLRSHRGSGLAVPAPKAEYLIGAVLAASIGLTSVQAATLGHSRILSGAGQPLHVEIPVTELTQQELESLTARPAPPAAWRDAGMTPPVSLESMHLVLLDGYRPGAKVIQLRSAQASDQPVVDILLDIRSAAGQQRYQVSLLAHSDDAAIQRAQSGVAPTARSSDAGPAGAAGHHASAGRRIAVRSGDTMFGIARRNAVRGVTIYQMMIALQRANPKAFIENNVNLVRAGATLVMPDYKALTALSDREARRIFMEHAQAFARYRQRSGGADIASVSLGNAGAQGAVSEVPSAEIPATIPSQTGDRLRLSGGNSTSGKTAAANTGQGNGGVAAAAADAPQGNDAGTWQGQDAKNPSGSKTPLSVLASSGAIASDAVTEKAPNAASADFGIGKSGVLGSDAADQATAATAGGGSGVSSSPDPDDAAATRKGIDESRQRITELEDNVRHLNEALQKQGQVAAEAAIEGARSVTETVREIIGIGAGTDTGSASGEGAGMAAEPPATGAAAEKASSSGKNGSGAAALSTAPDGTAGSPQTSSIRDRGVGTDASGATAGGGSATIPSSPPGGGDTSASVSPSATSGTRATTGNSAAPTSGALAGPGGSSVADANGSISSSTNKAVEKVSWMQENGLAIIGTALAFVVLLVVWLLRRAGAAKRDAFETDSPITDTMVRDKLREIDLDLDRPTVDAGRRSS